MNVDFYHNPRCGTSRNTLALIRQAGIEPRVIEYLKTPARNEGLAPRPPFVLAWGVALPVNDDPASAPSGIHRPRSATLRIRTG